MSPACASGRAPCPTANCSRSPRNLLPNRLRRKGMSHWASLLPRSDPHVATVCAGQGRWLKVPTMPYDLTYDGYPPPADPDAPPPNWPTPPITSADGTTTLTTFPGDTE